MKYQTVSPELLRPIQDSFNSFRLEYLLDKFDPALLDPVPVIHYQLCGEEQRYLLGDGHHRSAMFYLCGEDVPLKILETDREISDCENGAFFSIDSKKDFLDQYKMYWRRSTEQYHLKSIPDLVRSVYTSREIETLKKIAQKRMTLSRKRRK